MLSYQLGVAATGVSWGRGGGPASCLYCSVTLMAMCYCCPVTLWSSLPVSARFCHCTPVSMPRVVSFTEPFRSPHP